MGDDTLLQRIFAWVTFLPINFAFWLIWLSAKSGNLDARMVHEAMWDADLDVRPLTASQKEQARQELWPEDEE